MESPFKYGVTVSEISFTDRKKDRIKLSTNLLNGINSILISPRRWGKSSLVENVILNINVKHTKVKTVIIDMFSVDSEESFLELYAREVIKASSTQWEDWLHSGKEFFKHLLPKLSVGVDPNNDFSLKFDWEDLMKHKDEILNLPEKIASVKDLKFIICLDEFQNLASFSSFKNFEKQMRAVWQRQKHVTYCLYGSKRHMMIDIFNNSTKPFYRFGDIILLEKIETKYWLSFIIDNFKHTEKHISLDQAKIIAGLMQNHSWYVQQLSHYVWQKTDDKVSEKIMRDALNELIYANTPLYQREIEELSVTQVNLLKAILKGKKQLTSVKVMEKFRLGTPRNVSKNKQVLINKDIVNKLDRDFELLDPAFELWFRKIFFRENYLDRL